MKTRTLTRSLPWLLPMLLCLVLAACKPAEKPAPAPAPCEPCEPCNCPAPSEVAKAVPAAEAQADTGAPEVELPDECRLYHLADQYEPTIFSHTNHVEYADNCETCHHHSSQVEAAPPCRECHGVTSGDLRLPGLKGAYHRQCMNCHREMGAGPLDCEGCHAKADGAVSRDPYALALEAVGDEILLGHLALDFGGVRFKHRLHVEVTDACNECHHHEKGYEKTPPCRECHNTRSELKQAYHEQCLGCHRTTSAKRQARVEDLLAGVEKARAEGRTEEVETLRKRVEQERERGASPLSCKDCHLPKKAPKSMDLGHVAKLFGPVPFDHAGHVQAAAFCTDCHHTNKNYEVFQPCRSCHGDDDHPGKNGAVIARAAYHGQCIGCHQKDNQGPVGCTSCHKPKELPPSVTIDQASNVFEAVTFDHEMHLGTTDDCIDCHHAPQSYKGVAGCGSCHKETDEGKTLNLEKALHKQCIGCHKKDDQGPTGCDACHKPKAVPESISLGALSEKYAPATFDHAMHLDASDGCTDCHHGTPQGPSLAKCGSCHKAAAEGNSPSLKDALHKQCIDCHKKDDQGPTGCEDCHAARE